MIIRIDQSELFTIDPAKRFSKQYKVDDKFWTDMWRRYKALGYTIHDLCEFYELRTKKNIPKRAMRRWLYRTEIYWRAAPAIKKGAQSVLTEYFGDMEWFVINELTTNAINSGKVPKSVV